MSIIEEIKRGVRHDFECEQHAQEYLRNGGTRQPRCLKTCSRRRKIAWLERLEEPTEAMTLHALKECDRNGYAWTRGMIDELDVNTAFKAMLKAAEEDLP